MDFVRFHRRRHGRPHLESDNLRSGSESCFLGFISSNTRVRISYKKTVRIIVKNHVGQRKSLAGNRSVIPAGDFFALRDSLRGYSLRGGFMQPVFIAPQHRFPEAVVAVVVLLPSVVLPGQPLAAGPEYRAG